MYREVLKMKDKPPAWFQTILEATPPVVAWKSLHSWLLEQALALPDSAALQNATVQPDRLLTEAAWTLWEAYPTLPNRTASLLNEWWETNSHGGRAVLILDALSLRELRFLLAGADARGIKPTQVAVSASEVPSDTEAFAASLGAPGRASLAGGVPPAGFQLQAPHLHTAILQGPFEHCLGDVKPVPSLLLWHPWLDDMIHSKMKPVQLAAAAQRELQSDGFWLLVNRLRQGRKLVITSDHGYAVSELFSVNENDAAKQVLQTEFGATRYRRSVSPLPGTFLIPLALSFGEYQVVVGQRRWPVKGGFPDVSHGGLTLLETAVPFVELPEA